MTSVQGVSRSAVGLIGVDIGGTFTDLVFYDGATSDLRVIKGLTTPASLETGVLGVIESGLSSAELQEASLFLHATTVALNTLLQRTGATVGILATGGFRDVLELRRADRLVMNDPLWAPPPPLVPRRLRVGVKERVRSDGSVHAPLDPSDVQTAFDTFSREGVEVIAVTFLHSYRNPEHELEAETLLRQCGFAGEIVLSHKVSGEYREYERTSTTVVDAYIRPKLSHYMQRLGTGLHELGFRGQLLVTTSGGGSMTFAEADERPVESVNSGPAAGVVATGELCRALDIDIAISADVGGTSFDTSLVIDGRPTVRYEGSIAGAPLQTPWVDVRSIGAGGGSIAFMDEGGLLQVGPQSAGSDPGPACYGRGGTEATATDAAAVLGMLGLGQIGGSVQLDFDRARATLAPLAGRLDATEDETARGVLTVLSAHMADTIREMSLERGLDPRAATLMAFGGAGSLFAPLIAAELDIGRIVVPNHPGVLSAWGLLRQDLTRAAARTLLVRLDDAGVKESGELAHALFRHLTDRGDLPELAGASDSILELALDVRYVGQEYPLTIAATFDGEAIAESVTKLEDRFLEESSRAYGYKRRAPLEIVSVRATLRTPVPRQDTPGLSEIPRRRSRQAPSIDAFSFDEGSRVPFRIVDRSELGAGDTLEGPMIVTEATATTYLDTGWLADTHPSGHLLIERKADR